MQNLQRERLDTPSLHLESLPEPLGPARWDWRKVRRVLIIRLRSIGDTVLATPSLFALRRFLPEAQIDILLEDWVAPLIENCRDVDRVITLKRGSALARARLAPQLRTTGYDVAFNLHGGTTAAFLTRASGAAHRVGYAGYRYHRLYTDAAPPASLLWGRENVHSVEQQLALLGWTGVPVSDRPATRLEVSTRATETAVNKLRTAGIDGDEQFAVIHPAAAFESKQWATNNFARVAEYLHDRGIRLIAVAAPHETEIIKTLQEQSRVCVPALTELTLPEVTALISRAFLFVGNDSGIAHIAAAVQTPSVVIFGSSNVNHWRPWAIAPAEVVREEMPCAPCAGYTCAEFERPECIRRISVERVIEAIDRVLAKNPSPRQLSTALVSHL